MRINKKKVRVPLLQKLLILITSLQNLCTITEVTTTEKVTKSKGTTASNEVKLPEPQVPTEEVLPLDKKEKESNNVDYEEEGCDTDDDSIDIDNDIGTEHEPLDVQSDYTEDPEHENDSSNHGEDEEDDSMEREVIVATTRNTPLIANLGDHKVVSVDIFCWYPLLCGLLIYFWLTFNHFRK